ncbi:galactose-1-phosphate uridylyltransferase, partial [Clostridium tetanomorphum DSM 665]
MSNYRREVWNGKYVLISEKRGDRPYDFNNSNEKNNISFKADCPFCVGNEKESDNAIYEVGTPWIVRVIPNKYPCIEYNINNDEICGYHYVVVESREHNKKLHEFTSEHIYYIIKSYITVCRDIYKDNNIKYIQIFKNYKKEAGASLSHPHSQIIALNIIPEKIKRTIKYNHNLYVKQRKCLYCNIIKEEKRFKERIIYENSKFICFCSIAPIFSYEVTIMKKDHVGFLNFSTEDIESLSYCIYKIQNKIFLELGDIPLNIGFYFSKKDNNYSHFYLNIYPRISRHAGFEITTGIIQNSVSPERAAK